VSSHRPCPTGFALASIRAALFLCALIFALPARAGTTWDGGGANSSWGTANNWNPNALPLFNGTETITIGTGFASGLILTLDGTRYINDLVINTTSGFTIAAGTGGTLNLRSGNLTRQDVTGTEAVQTISAGMVLGDPTGVAAYTGTWNIAGSNSLNVTGNVSEAGGSRGVTKTGAGTLILSGTNTFSGGLAVNAGIVSISSNANLARRPVD
jgi:autotransporter-associated beta strand protein